MDTSDLIEVTAANFIEMVKAAYDLSSPYGMGEMHYREGGLSDEEARELLERGHPSPHVFFDLDYVRGRACKLGVLRGPNGRLWLPRPWHRHTDEQLAELLARSGVAPAPEPERTVQDEPTAEAGRPIDSPYTPDQRIGEFGWLWLSEDDAPIEGWALAHTYETPEDTLRVELWSAWHDDADDWSAERFRGQPYLPLSAPACEPGAGLLATVHLPAGASLAHSWGEPGLATDAARDRLLTAIDFRAPDPSAEPDMRINGVRLTDAQAMTLRVAISNWLVELDDVDALGADERGRKLADGYRARLAEIVLLMRPS